MGYMQDIERELQGVLAPVRDLVEAGTIHQDYLDTLIRFVKEKLLESYRNGIAAGKSGKADRPTARPTTRRADRQE